jgi:hypothetical protein
MFRNYDAVLNRFVGFQALHEGWGTDRELVKMARLEVATDLLRVRTGIFFVAGLMSRSHAPPAGKQHGKAFPTLCLPEAPYENFVGDKNA